MKCVWTLIRAGDDGRRPKKCRAVVCGNMQDKPATEVLYTSQVDIATLLVVIRLAGENHLTITRLKIERKLARLSLLPGRKTFLPFLHSVVVQQKMAPVRRWG